MPATLVVPSQIADDLRSVASRSVETAGVLLVSVVEVGTDVRLLAREMHWSPDDCYLARGSDSMSIASDGYVPALGRADAIGASALWVHTHPGADAIPLPSSHDRVVDEQLADVFRLRSGSPFYGALIVSPRVHGITFSGHLSHEHHDARIIDRVWLVGSRLHLELSYDQGVAPLPEMFDRNVRAFGEGVQRILGSLHIAVVGCGGTGSSVVEQLVRLGVRQFSLFDPDVLTETNVTRVYGSTLKDVGRKKVDVLLDHIQRIAPSATCYRFDQTVTHEAVARQLGRCDVIFGCTDDNAGRLVLSRAATYLMTPVIDSGVLLSSEPNGALQGIDGRVTVLVPGQACLICRGRIDLKRAAAEMLSPSERVKREDEGYAPALARTEPAVVSFTSGVAVAAVNELLERLIGYGAEPRPSELLLRFHEREVSSNVAAPRSKHYCDSKSEKLGLGFSNPLFDISWSS